MVSEPLISATILFALIVLGEIISYLTKARVPMLLTAMVSYLLLSWAGVLPEKILDNAILPSLGALIIAPVIMHMGTMMPLHILKSQWKAVVISILGILGSTTLILVFVTLLFDFRTAASGVGPIAGGIVASSHHSRKASRFRIGQSHCFTSYRSGTSRCYWYAIKFYPYEALFKILLSK